MYVCYHSPFERYKMFKIGPHIILDKLPLSLVEKWQPTTATLLDPSIDYVRNFKQASPNTKLVVRIYRPDSEFSGRIRNKDKQFIKDLHNQASKYIGVADYIQFNNEVMQFWDELPLLNEFTLETMHQADNYGYKLAIYSFSVGNLHLPNPDENPDKMIYWKQVYSGLEYAANHGHILSIHQYGYPTLNSEAGYEHEWLLHRFEKQVWPNLPFKNLKVICTEYGIDHLLIGKKKSWRSNISKDNYLQQLQERNDEMQEWDYMMGYNLFTFGGSSEWEDYFHESIANDVADIAYIYNKKHKDTMPNFQGRKAFVNSPYGLNLRETPNGELITTLSDNVSLTILETVNKWHKIKLSSGNIGWVHSDYVTFDTPISETQPDVSLDKLNPLYLQAIFNIESGNRFFENDKPIIRFEAHIFVNKVPTALSYFRFDYMQKWRNQQMKINNQWYQIHTGNQESEWVAYNLAKQIDINAAIESTSWGAPQIMGFHWERLGFDSPEDFVNTMSQNELSQQEVFYRFLKTDIRLIEAIKNLDHYKVANIYNGSGQVDYYADLIEREYERLLSESENEPEEVIGNKEQMLQHIANIRNELSLLENLLKENLNAPTPDPLPPIEDKPTYTISTGATTLGIKVIETHNPQFKLMDIWTTFFGKWDVGQASPYAIEQFYRDKYLKPWNHQYYIDDAGGDHHIFVGIFDENGVPVSDYPVQFSTENFNSYDVLNTKQHGFSNVVLYPSSNYDPMTQKGPWKVRIGTDSDIVTGIGLPNGHHVSTWVTYRKVG